VTGVCKEIGEGHPSPRRARFFPNPGEIAQIASRAGGSFGRALAPVDARLDLESQVRAQFFVKFSFFARPPPPHSYSCGRNTRATVRTNRFQRDSSRASCFLPDGVKR
jgi:hypothetical protein